MATVEIDIDDYLSEDEKRSIARDAFRLACAAHTKKDFERILSNAGYALVEKEVDAVFDGGMAETVKTTAINVIGNLTAHTVFKRPSAWDTESSKAYVHLQRAMDEAFPAIKERVSEIIAAMTEDDLRYLIERQVGDAILAKLTATASPTAPTE